jgi:hypothetical protein
LAERLFVCRAGEYCHRNIIYIFLRRRPLIQVIDEISPRSKDSIVGLGERLSCKMMTAVLRDQVGFILEIIANGSLVHADNRALMPNMYRLKISSRTPRIQKVAVLRAH